MKALEGALAQERAKEEAVNHATELLHGLTVKNIWPFRTILQRRRKGPTPRRRPRPKQTPPGRTPFEAARRKVAEERAKTEAELAAFKAGKARLQRAREAEAARAREEIERRAAAATAAAMEEAEAKLQRETPPGGS